VHLQDLVNVGSGNLQGDQHLYYELVARGRHQVGWSAKPLGQLAVACRCDPVSLPRPLAFPVAGLDESVPLEALESRVDLPNVERPDLARPSLEFALQPQAILRLLAEQGKEGMRNAHYLLSSMVILSTILSIIIEHKLVRSRGARRARPEEPLVGPNGVRSVPDLLAALGSLWQANGTKGSGGLLRVASSVLSPHGYTGRLSSVPPAVESGRSGRRHGTPSQRGDVLSWRGRQSGVSTGSWKTQRSISVR
jgi:hypothetical protein